MLSGTLDMQMARTAQKIYALFVSATIFERDAVEYYCLPCTFRTTFLQAKLGNERGASINMEVYTAIVSV